MRQHTIQNTTQTVVIMADKAREAQTEKTVNNITDSGTDFLDTNVTANVTADAICMIAEKVADTVTTFHNENKPKDDGS
jgi:hypothetical protein